MFDPIGVAIGSGGIGHAFWPAALLTFALWFAGACFASFAGLVAYRIGSVPEGGSVIVAISYPHSHCDACGRRIGALALVPVFGWLLTRGRCPHCGAAVPAVYPLSEALFGAVVAALPWISGHLPFAQGVWVAFLLCVLLLAAWIDAREHVIPEELTWVLLFSGLLASPLGWDAVDRVSAASICAAAMYAALALTGWFKGLDTRAGGDVALAAAAGAWLGTEDAPAFLFLSSLAYVAYAAPARRRGTLWVPMGPGLASGCAGAALARLSGILPSTL